MTDERKEELFAIIVKMQKVSNGFYAEAVRCDNHAFIEFTGFMNEYIKICVDSLEKGIDFTKCNIHGGDSLQVQDYQKEYIQKKLECIFSGSLTLSQNDD